MTETAATQEHKLPAGTVLLGTITAQNSAYALIRTADGAIARVGPGDGR